VAFAIELPGNFVAEDMAPGAGFIVPVSIAFMPDGRLMVGEKQGRVWIVKNGVKYPIPMWEHESEVLDDGDRGLLAVTADPNYATNHYVYFMYTVDPDSDNVDTNSDGYGRLVRFQTSAADSNVVDLSTRAVLFGRVWAEGPTIGSITHTIGSLRWGRDGSLLASMGDGAQYDYADAGGQDAAMFLPGRANPYEDTARSARRTCVRWRASSCASIR
jgi:glucose/arabinose dehydrogenase